MIRFGAVLAVVVIAFGLLATGFVAGSLLLVAISIGVSALGLLMFLVVVVSLRHEIFAPGPAARQGDLVAQAAGVAAASAGAGIGRDNKIRAETEHHGMVPSADARLAEAWVAAARSDPVQPVAPEPARPAQPGRIPAAQPEAPRPGPGPGRGARPS